ncbi:Flagellar secretion chaperone FliS [Moorella thermoacetica]|uniref:Flagellar secretion chaperone FliS n=1 Tax=Neomoorella thermoacetica TaxID=1525 RepID=A0AAC9HGL9_NEOTH|nr:flagellar export chaperone FliS [Moorella thermoacetica]AOQ23422.1 Flagellar protein FliS [Moorella thermoacetica]TYL13607.1 Flagellar secretion chaperone FliS [Moorella thermoacetica]
MAVINPYQAYRQNQVQTLSQEKLVLMLYDGALRFCRQGLVAMEQNDYAAVSNNLGRAEDILSELMATLNRDVGDIAENLYKLYDFMYRHLVQANVKKSGKMINEVIELLQQLRDTWEEAIKIYQAHDYRTTAGVNWQG